MPFYQLPSGASPVLAGAGVPTGGVGNNGDLFIDTSNAVLYGPKAAGSWPTGIVLSNGPTGPAFPFYVTGPTAPASAAAGAVWLDTDTGKHFVRYDGLWVQSYI